MNNLDRDGFVYFAKRRDGLTKIGHARVVAPRISALRRYRDPSFVTLAHAIATNRAMILEHALHQCYAEFHVRGEWFFLPAAELEVIRSVRYVQVKPGVAFTAATTDGSPCICLNRWKGWQGTTPRGRPRQRPLEEEAPDAPHR